VSDKVVAGANLIGSKENPNEVWLVVGRISNLGLEVIDVKKTGSHILAKDLSQYKTLSALGVDSPLSFPAAFLDFLACKKLKKNYQSWQEAIEELVFIPPDELAALAKEFGKEPKRITDTTDGATANSPLKRANPNMLHITHHSIRTLASLDPKRFFALPFQNAIPFGCSIIEVQPKDTLKALGVQPAAATSKDKVDETLLEAQRDKLVQNLIKAKERKAITMKDLPGLVIQKNFLHNFRHSDHAIDALINCYTTAMYTANRTHFDDPFAADALEVLLEGWIYRAKIQ
jgi:hypothetical protein